MVLELEIETNNSCFLCLKPLVNQAPKAGINASKNTDSDSSSAAAFKALLRFLNVSELDQLSLSKVDLTILTLCDGCSALLYQFWQVYQDFEIARILLEALTKEVHNQMTDGNKSREDITKKFESKWSNPQPDTMNPGGLGQKLWTETLKKCLQKLDTSVPRVKLLKRKLRSSSSSYSSSPQPSTIPDDSNHSILEITPAPEVSAKSECTLEESVVRETNFPHVIETPFTFGREPNAINEQLKQQNYVYDSNLVNFENLAAEGLGEKSDEQGCTYAVDPLQQDYTNTTPDILYIPMEYSNANGNIGNNFVSTNNTILSSLLNGYPSAQDNNMNIFSQTQPQLEKDHHQPQSLPPRHINIAPASFTCDYCGLTSLQQHVHDKHVKVTHPFQAFYTCLPRGITEPQLLQVLWHMVEQHKAPVDGSRPPGLCWYNCSYCELVIGSSHHFKYHILNWHFDKVLDELRMFSTN